MKTKLEVLTNIYISTFIIHLYEYIHYTYPHIRVWYLHNRVVKNCRGYHRALIEKMKEYLKRTE